MHKFILFKSSYFLTWNDYSKHIKKQSIQKAVHITISSQLLMLYSSGLKYNISKYQTWFSTHPGPFKTFKEKSLTLKNPQFSTPCTLQVVLTTIKNIRDISDRFNIVWCLNATWLYIFLPSLSLYKDQCCIKTNVTGQSPLISKKTLSLMSLVHRSFPPPNL